jgi:hypothetical protein
MGRRAGVRVGSDHKLRENEAQLVIRPDPHSCNRASAVAASGRNPSKRLTKLFFLSLVSLVLVVRE